MEREDDRLVRCATVSLIGRPSVGKSTLVNTICEMKVSITASTPQTTRNAIRGIYTDQRGQLIFTDTPGYHLGGREINRRMQEKLSGYLSVLFEQNPQSVGGQLPGDDFYYSR